MIEKQQLNPRHKWDPETRFLDEQVRAAGCVALVDFENEGLVIFPPDKIPRVLSLQMMINGKQLGRAYCRDLLEEAGYSPDETA